MSNLLDDFEIIRHSGESPFMTLSKYGITFSKLVIECLGHPEYVHAFLDRKGLRFAVQPSARDKDAIAFMKDDAAKARSFVRWSNRGLQREILELMHMSMEGGAIRINGAWHEDEDIIIFDLSDHQPAANGKSPGR